MHLQTHSLVFSGWTPDIKHIKAQHGEMTYGLYSLLSHLLPCSLYEASAMYFSRLKENWVVYYWPPQKKNLSWVLCSLPALSPHLRFLSN